MKYTLTTDIDYNSTKSEITLFANTHGCKLSKFQINGPAGGNHICEFSSNNLDFIQELCDQLDLPYSKIKN